MNCTSVWPDHLINGRPVFCHEQVEGHNLYWHTFWYEIHTGKPGGGSIQWPTALHDAVTAGKVLTPTVVASDLPGVPHEVVLHPTHVMLHSHRPVKR
ncbi:MAG: hypothetical protein WB777_14280 [Mycobacterium sp.]